MRCERVRFLYDEYSQGTLPVSTLGRVEEHLAACPSCRDHYDQNDTIADVIRKSAEVAHPGPAYFEGLHARVLAVLDQPETQHIADPAEIIDIPSTQWRRPLWWVGGAAAAALFAVSLFASQQPEKSRDYARIDPIPPKALIPTPAPPVQPPAQGTQSAPQAPLAASTPSKVWDKGINAPPVQSLIPQNHYGATDPAKTSELAQQKRDQTQMELVSRLRREAEKSETLAPEVFKQLQLLKTQIVEGGNEDLRRSLRDLEQLVNSRISDQDKLNSNPLVKQAKIYVDANDDLLAKRTDEAMNKYRQILFIEEAPSGKPSENQSLKSPVAIKAALQMADLFYSVWTNFEEARKYYQKCSVPEAQGVLTSFEQARVKGQLDRLERYKANNWQALELLNKIQYGKWTEVRSALKSLVAMGGTSELLPDAARWISKHMDGTDEPTPDIALDLYKTLEKQAKVEQNVDVRAWLELVLGDLAAGPVFQDTQAALNYYGLAAASGSSDATMQARAKLKEMENENWAELVRNRK